jgi:hypothetical protein
MYRRRFLTAAAYAALPLFAAGPAGAHTPYRQWDIFRKRYLQVLTSRTDATGDGYGDDWVAVLREKLPLSRALVSRARDMARIASLLKTNQGKLAVLSYADAHAMFSGKAPFDEYAPMPLQVLLDRGTHLLVTRSDLPVHHGYLIAATLMESARTLQLEVPLQGRLGMALHAGARAYAAGEQLEMPAAES